MDVPEDVEEAPVKMDEEETEPAKEAKDDRDGEKLFSSDDFKIEVTLNNGEKRASETFEDIFIL
jgi:hypothetical protein